MATGYMTHTQTPQGAHVQFVESLERLAQFENDCLMAGKHIQQIQITSEIGDNDLMILAIAGMPFTEPITDQVYQDCVNWLVANGHAAPPSQPAKKHILVSAPLASLMLRKCSHVDCDKNALYTIRIELRPAPNATPSITNVPLGMCEEHKDVTFEEIMPDAQWRSLRAEFAAQGYSMPKRKYSNIVILPIA